MTCCYYVGVCMLMLKRSLSSPFFCARYSPLRLVCFGISSFGICKIRDTFELSVEPGHWVSPGSLLGASCGLDRFVLLGSYMDHYCYGCCSMLAENLESWIPSSPLLVSKLQRPYIIRCHFNRRQSQAIAEGKRVKFQRMARRCQAYVVCNSRMWVCWFLLMHVELQSSGDCAFLSFALYPCMHLNFWLALETATMLGRGQFL